jgi:hypothetical protein
MKKVQNEQATKPIEKTTFIFTISNLPKEIVDFAIDSTKKEFDIELSKEKISVDCDEISNEARDSIINLFGNMLSNASAIEFQKLPFEKQVISLLKLKKINRGL